MREAIREVIRGHQGQSERLGEEPAGLVALA